MKLLAVPGGDPGFVIGRIFLRIKPESGDLVGNSDFISAAAFGQRTFALVHRTADAGERIALGFG